MFPDGGAAFLWRLGGCGMRGYLTLILVQDGVQDANPDSNPGANQDGGPWRVEDPGLSTPPGSTFGLEKGDPIFDAPTGFTKQAKPVCRLIWHWKGTELRSTDAHLKDAYVKSKACAVDG